MAEDVGSGGQGLARLVALLHEQNIRTREQFVRTRLVAEQLWELWDGEAATLFGAEWELADGRARALLDEELAILALLPASDARAEAPPLPKPVEQTWDSAELLQLMEHAAEHFHAQQQELEAALAARDELIGRAEPHTREDEAGYAAEHRLWLKRAEDVVRRLAALSAGVRAARNAYTHAGRINARIFGADFFAEPDDDAGTAPEAAPEAGEEAHLSGQLSPEGFAALAGTLTEAAERLVKALIAAELALERIGPIARQKERERAEQYDRRSQAVFLLAGDCLRAEILLARSVRQAGRNWEVVEWDAGGRRGALPEAVKAKEVVEMRIAPPPSASARDGRKPGQGAAQQAEAVWRALAAEVDTLDKAVVAAGGFDSPEAEALEAALGQIAARLYAVQDGASELADLCAELRAQHQLPWWRRSSWNAKGGPRD